MNKTKAKHLVILTLVGLLAIVSIAQGSVGTVVDETFDYPVGDSITIHGWPGGAGGASSLISGTTIDQGNCADLRAGTMAAVYCRYVNPDRSLWPLGDNETAVLTFAYRDNGTDTNTDLNKTYLFVDAGHAIQCSFTMQQANGKTQIRIRDSYGHDSGYKSGGPTDNYTQGYIRMLLTNDGGSVTAAIYCKHNRGDHWTQLDNFTTPAAGLGWIEFWMNAPQVDKTSEMLYDSVSLLVVPGSVTDPNAAGFPFQLLFVGITDSQLTQLWKDALTQYGWTRTFADWNDLTSELLQTCRLVVLATLPERGEVTPADNATRELLADYVSGGGGLLILDDLQARVTAMTLPQYVAGRFNLKILLEGTASDPNSKAVIGPNHDTYTYAWEGQIHDPPNWSGHSIKDNFADNGTGKGTLYQSWVSQDSYSGLLPFDNATPNAGWQTILDAGYNSSSSVWSFGLWNIDNDSRSQDQVYTHNVPLMGVYDNFTKPGITYGGRIGYAGQNPDNIFIRDVSNPCDSDNYSAYMYAGYHDKVTGRTYAGNLKPLFLNLFAWLSAKSDNLATVTLVNYKGNVTPPAYDNDTFWKLFKGIIGAQTDCTNPNYPSAEAYINAAKTVGLDFIVFLDNFSEPTYSVDQFESNFEHLRTVCNQYTDNGTFVAIPGIIFRNSDGNWEYAFSRYLQLPSTNNGGLFLDNGTTHWFNVWPDDARKGIDPITDAVWLKTALGFKNHSGWYGFNNSPYPHFDMRCVDTMGVVTQTNGGTVVEDNATAYGQEARNGQFLWPIALTQITSANEINNLASGNYYLTVLGAYGKHQLVPFLNGDNDSRTVWDPQSPSAIPFGTTYFTKCTTSPLTLCPAIDNFSLPRADINPQGDSYNPILQSWKLNLTVSDNASALKEILVYDGDQVIRRFRSPSSPFSYSTYLTVERQKAIWVQATDNANRTAVTRDIECNSYLLRENQLADRKDRSLDSYQNRQGADAQYGQFILRTWSDCPTPDKGPWDGDVMPVDLFKADNASRTGCTPGFDGNLGGGSSCRLCPSVVRNGSVPAMPANWFCLPLVTDNNGIVEGGQHCRPYRVVASSDVLVGEHRMDYVFDKTADPIRDVWCTLFPVVGSTSNCLQTTARTYLYRVKVEGISAYLWDQTFTALQTIPLDNASAYSLGLGNIYGSTGTGCTKVLLVQNGVQTLYADNTPISSVTYTLNRGDYIGFLNSPFGSTVIYSLTDGVVVSTTRANGALGYKYAGTSIPSGTQIEVKLLCVGMNKLVADPVALAAQVRRDYGLDGGATNYTVTAQQGRVVTKSYPVSLGTSFSNCFKGTFGNLANLAGNLGCTVSTLNSNWSACLQVQNGSSTRTRFIPVEAGVGYAVLESEADSQTVFIGHPITADNPSVVLNLARTAVSGGSWQLEVHNPTDQTITTTVTNHPQVVGFSINERMTLAPGTSTFRVVNAAPGSTVNLSGRVILQDYSGAAASVSLTVQLRGTTTRTDVVAPDANGNFTVGGVLPGTYGVWIKAPHWLGKLISGVGVGSNDVNIGTVSLINGDGDGDNRVTGDDVSTVLAALDGTSGGLADVDGDGAITSTDLSIVLAHLDLTGD